MEFTPAETSACCRLIELALHEDIGRHSLRGDPTSWSIIPPGYKGQANLVARSAGVLAGLPAVALVLGMVDPQLNFEPQRTDGFALQPGDRVATIQGPIHSLFMAERTALNFLQHLSGIATQTRRYVEAIAGLPCRILDTRKTLPGWRLLEKYAVRCGGGHNHRMGLYDGILIKDNHLAAIAHQHLTLSQAIRLARFNAPEPLPLEIEVDTLTQLEEALANGPDMVLLDNMPLEHLREAVRRRNAIAPQVQLEASGGITLANVRAIAETGVERISIGALTHSAPALDLALDYLSA